MFFKKYGRTILKAELFLALSIFLVSFYIPISSKAVNNIFYCLIALPVFLMLILSVDRKLVISSKGAIYLTVALSFLGFVSFYDYSSLKPYLYIILLFYSLVIIDSHSFSVNRAYFFYSVFGFFVFVVALTDWAFRGGFSSLFRYSEFFGKDINPVYFSLMIVSGFLYFWVFHISSFLKSKSRFFYIFGFFAFLSLILICAVLFQSRSVLLGCAAFLVFYFVRENEYLLFGMVMIFLVITFLYLDISDIFLQRGLSYRTDIWLDAWLRLKDTCGLLQGCGDDKYLFLGKFYHPHSGYLSVLYEGGMLALGVLIIIVSSILWLGRKSSWVYLAVYGWASVIVTTSGVISSPQPYWIYLWIPSFMAVIDSQRVVRS